MNININGIVERDMDLLFLRLLSRDDSFLLKMLLNEIGYQDKKLIVLDIQNSVHSIANDKDGESDIEVILQDDNGNKIALLIEDKINAQAQKGQEKRYHERGEEGKTKGKYDETHVFIIAPKDYLKANAEAKKYEHKISYENVLENADDAFDKTLIQQAICKTRGPADPDEQVTLFWNRLYSYVEENYQDLSFKIHGKPGTLRNSQKGQWITMNRIRDKRYNMEIKSDRGFVDLEITGYGDMFNKFYNDNKELIDKERLCLRPTGRSLSVRKYIECIDFSKPFEEEEEKVKAAFDAAMELQGLIGRIDLR